MDIRLLIQTSPSLHIDLLPEVQERVYQSGRNTSKAQPITQRKGRRQEQWRVSLVLGDVEREVRVQNGSDVVWRASIVVRDSA